MKVQIFLGAPIIKLMYFSTIENIEIKKFPVVIFSDTHTAIQVIKSLKELYPNCQLLCLGDITFLYREDENNFNKKSIDYFIDNNIPSLLGNHDQYVLSCSIGDNLVSHAGDLTDSDIFNLTQPQIDFLKKLPTGFRLIYHTGEEYLCFHNKPNDLWSHIEPGFKEFALKRDFPIGKLTKSILVGHQHKQFIIEYPNNPVKIYSIGRLSRDGNYALLTENGIELKKL